MRVVFAGPAESDLEEIADWISRDDPQLAGDFVERLAEAGRGLSLFPKRFPLGAGREDAGIRRRVHGHHLIFYRIDPEQVTIIRILHVARDYEAALFLES